MLRSEWGVLLVERKKLALVLAGGGITGAVYEIGSLRALDDAFGESGSVAKGFDIYVGVSAGSVISALLANGIHPERTVQAIIEGTKDLLNFQREDVYRPDVKFLIHVLGTALSALSMWPFKRISRKSKENSQSLLDILETKLPSGIFPLDHLEEYIRKLLSEGGRSNDFRRLKKELYIPATELDTGECWIFGDSGLNEVPISQAVAASSAIPIFFRPYRVLDHDFVDGAISKIAHVHVPIDKGACSILVINPLVPIYNDREQLCIPLQDGHCARIMERGFVSIFNQSARINLYEKLHLGLGYYQEKFPDVKIILHEPSRTEAPMFLKNPMSFEARAQLVDYGYSSMKAHLKKEWDTFKSFFSRHGLELQEKKVFGEKGREASAVAPSREEDVDLFRHDA
jgi:predicted acylesterase/phospholipase RssA